MTKQLNLVEKIKQYIKKRNQEHDRKIKRQIRNEFILAYWDELKFISQRVQLQTPSEQNITFQTLNDLELLLAPEEVELFEEYHNEQAFHL